jgi:hypothetical protein
LTIKRAEKAVVQGKGALPLGLEVCCGQLLEEGVSCGRRVVAPPRFHQPTHYQRQDVPQEASSLEILSRLANSVADPDSFERSHLSSSGHFRLETDQLLETSCRNKTPASIKYQ